MKPIEKILHTISIFYYVFVVLFAISMLYGFAVGIMSAINQTPADSSQWGMTKAILVLALSLATLVTSVWAIILFIRLLICIGRSIARKDIFNMQTVRLINRYALIYSIMLVIIIISGCVVPNVYGDSVAEMYVVGSMLSEISSVVILLMFAQVLKIGYILKEDLDLTV